MPDSLNQVLIRYQNSKKKAVMNFLSSPKRLVITFAITILFLLSLNTSAQYYAVKGIVHHRDKQAFESLVIRVHGTDIEVHTHENGSFSIDKVPIENNSVSFQFLNYEVSFAYEFEANKLYEVDVMYNIKKPKKSNCKLKSVVDYKIPENYQTMESN